MAKRFTKSADMAGILLQQKELNRPGVFDETQWFKAYSKGLAQNYTVTELKKAIEAYEPWMDRNPEGHTRVLVELAKNAAHLPLVQVGRHALLCSVHGSAALTSGGRCAVFQEVGHALHRLDVLGSHAQDFGRC